MKYLYSIVLLFVIAGGNVFAQSDTVSYRSLRSWLGDSTVIRYELGSLCHSAWGAQEYLHFAIDSAKAKTLADWFRTKPFMISGNDDTLTLYRHIRHEGPEPYSAPSTSAYNAMTTVLFILEVRQSKTDQLLQRLDTLASYLDRNGDLRYESFPRSNNTVKSFSLKQIAPRTEVYLTLTRAASLPVGVAAVREELSPQINAYPKISNPTNASNIITDFGDEDAAVKTIHSTPQKKTAKNKGAAHRKTYTTSGGGVVQEVYEQFVDDSAAIIENRKRKESVVLQYDPYPYTLNLWSQDLFGFRFHSDKSGEATITVKQIKDTIPQLHLTSKQVTYYESISVIPAPPRVPPELLQKPITVDSLTLHQQINNGDNFMLLASHYLSNGTYLVQVMIDGKEIYHSKRGVH